MRTLSICCGLALLAACTKPAPQVATDSVPAAPMAAGATPAPVSLASVAGKWSMHTMSATSDSVLLNYELTATAEGSGWTITFPNRPPVPATAVAAGDSIVSDVGPYESVLRKGVQVAVHSIFRLEGSELVGTGVAHYTNAGADSVVNLRMRGTRNP